MPIHDLADFARAAPSGRLLGLDVGTKTIGVATSDALRMTATPLEVIRRGKLAEDAARLGALIKERTVVGLVIGLPVNMDGSEGPRCQSVRQIAANLDQTLSLPITFWDERWSTQAVTRAMIAADMSRKRRAEQVDRAAAAYILEGALERLRRIGGHG